MTEQQQLLEDQKTAGVIDAGKEDQLFIIIVRTKPGVCGTKPVVCGLRGLKTVNVPRRLPGWQQGLWGKPIMHVIETRVLLGMSLSVLRGGQCQQQLSSSDCWQQLLSTAVAHSKAVLAKVSSTGITMDSYQFLVYRHSEARQYKIGEAVYVWLKSQYSTGRAVVLATPDSLPANSQFAGRYLVRFSACGSTAHVRPERLLPVYQQQHALQHTTTQLQLPVQQQEHVSGAHQEQQLQQAVQQLTLSHAVPQQAAASMVQQHHQDQIQQKQQQQQQQQSLVLLVSSTVDYRRLARSQVQASDGVLELGCSYGVCSRMLQEHAAWLEAVDNSDEVIQEARKRSPHISFHQIDVLEQQSQLLQLAGCLCSCSDQTTSADINISTPAAAAASDGAGSKDVGAGSNGHTSLQVAAGSSNGSNSAAAAAAAAAAADGNGSKGLGAGSAASSNGHTSACTAAGVACTSCEVQPRRPPCSVVFADIGGNRQLESLVKLVPWVLRAIRPRLLVVKSEELAAAAEQQVAAEQQLAAGQQQQQQQVAAEQQQQLVAGQQQQQQVAAEQQQQVAAGQQLQHQAAGQQEQQQQLVHHRQNQQQVALAGQQEQQHMQQPLEPQAASLDQGQAVTTASAAAADLSVQLGVPSLQECDGVISHVASWWQRLEQQCGNPASLAEPWFVAARAAGFTKNPMRYPQRCTADGTRICRPHNYDQERGCFKQDSCPFDHVHCHHCLKPDHRAVDCPVR